MCLVVKPEPYPRRRMTKKFPIELKPGAGTFSKALLSVASPEEVGTLTDTYDWYQTEAITTHSTVDYAAGYR